MYASKFFSKKKSGTSFVRSSFSISEFFTSPMNASSIFLVLERSFLGVYCTINVFDFLPRVIFEQLPYVYNPYKVESDFIESKLTFSKQKCSMGTQRR